MINPNDTGRLVLYRISDLYKTGEKVNSVSYLPYMSVSGKFMSSLKKIMNAEISPAFYITWNDDKFLVSGNQIKKVSEFVMSEVFKEGWGI